MSQTEVQLIKNGAVVDADINGMSSSKLSGALPAISGASLTNLPAGAGKAKNLIINGAMLVAQRGTSSTSNIYQTVDRMAMIIGGVDENPTQAQVDVAAGTTPYSLGFRKAFKVTNGNQTGGLGTNDLIEAIRYRAEAQDIASSGWNYTDPNSFITLSFWVKSSVSFNMKGYFFTQDNSYNYPLETGTLTADTWTKITRTIPGNSNVVFNNDNEMGLTISFGVYGTLFSSANPAVNQWVAYSSATLTNPSETTWYTTNDATLEFTGMQLEVGDSATDFEHRSFAQELALCERYCETDKPRTFIVTRFRQSGGAPFGYFKFRTQKRATPSISTSGTTFDTSAGFGTPEFTSINENGSRVFVSGTVGVNETKYVDYGSGNPIIIDAEL